VVTTCVDVSWDRSTAYISVAGWRSDGTPHVEVVEVAPGTDWVVGWFTAPSRPERMARPVAVQGKRAPATSLVLPLMEAGVDVVEWDGVSGTGDLYDRIRASLDDGGDQLRHRDQPLLNSAGANAATRPVGDAWAWDRRKSTVDIAPLVSCTGALWLLLTKRKPARSAYEDRGLEVV